jgi:hypothetical protein
LEGLFQANFARNKSVGFNYTCVSEVGNVKVDKGVATIEFPRTAKAFPIALGTIVGMKTCCKSPVC